MKEVLCRAWYSEALCLQLRKRQEASSRQSMPRPMAARQRARWIDHFLWGRPTLSPTYQPSPNLTRKLLQLYRLYDPTCLYRLLHWTTINRFGPNRIIFNWHRLVELLFWKMHSFQFNTKSKGTKLVLQPRVHKFAIIVIIQSCPRAYLINTTSWRCMGSGCTPNSALLRSEWSASGHCCSVAWEGPRTRVDGAEKIYNNNNTTIMNQLD